jgi:hypothetical protein
MKACGAKTRSGGRCKKSGDGAGGRCKFHGGATPVGPASPNFRTGRHSKYLPSALLERYQTAIGDPGLISLRDEVALLDGRITQLLETVGDTGNLRLWKEARTRLDAFKGAGAKKGSVGAARQALQQLDDLIDAGLSDAATWEELRETLEARRKMAESETKRLKDLHQTVTVEQAMMLMAVLVDEVRKHVTDRNALAAIAAQVVRLTGQRSGETPAA